jgi:ATP-dependent helicase HrpA
MENAHGRRDLVIDDQSSSPLRSRIPPKRVSARHFDAWWKKQRHKTPDLLTFSRADMLRSDDADDHPDTWHAEDSGASTDLPLRAGRGR